MKLAILSRNRQLHSIQRVRCFRFLQPWMHLNDSSNVDNRASVAKLRALAFGSFRFHVEPEAADWNVKRQLCRADEEPLVPDVVRTVSGIGITGWLKVTVSDARRVKTYAALPKTHQLYGLPTTRLPRR